MPRPIRLFALSGSLQRESANGAILRAAVAHVPAGVEVDMYTGLGELPHFNPDLDGPQPPAAVQALRARLAAADALVIATPEYAHAMPGSLKNALDWLVGSGELVGKPAAVLGASTGATAAVRAQLQLVQLLGVMSAIVVETVGVGTVRSKLDAAGELVDAESLRRLEAAMHGLVRAIAPLETAGAAPA